ncbi:putative uncharacterized protein [Clostridium sp. CAG:277]|nr:S24/S26 family peptidase [Clostridium sp.]CDE69025.1 putative uncharacterized protein [Clostridium sp. CAG:277]
MIQSTFEQELDRKGTITYTCRGVSMLPLLRQQKDLFTITKRQSRCKKYDVALYKRADGAYVLHRIIKVLPDGYVFLGDNCLNKEYGITDQDVLGVMTSFVRDGKEYAADAGGCLLYAKVWYMLYPVRRLWKLLKLKIRRIGGHR